MAVIGFAGTLTSTGSIFTGGIPGFVTSYFNGARSNNTTPLAVTSMEVAARPSVSITSCAGDPPNSVRSVLSLIGCLFMAKRILGSYEGIVKK